MGSNNTENSPSIKRSRMDPMQNEAGESSTAPPNNLEHFPIEILMRIFGNIDDIGLLNLSINSCRFEKITKIILTGRYAEEYFIIDNDSDENVYEELFSRFGSAIKAIKLIGIRGVDKNHWITKMLKKHANRLEKLWFVDCWFKNAFDMLVNHMDIAHLTIFRGGCENETRVRLPKFQNLRKLELHKFGHVMEQSLKWIFLHNPQLVSLILRFCNHYFTLPETMEFVHKHLRQLKEFIVLENFDFQEDFPSEKCIEKFVDVSGGFESFGFTVDEEVMDIFRRISSECANNVKNLELYIMSGYLDEDMVKVARTFQKVESLTLSHVFDHVKDPVLSLVGSLPELRQFSFSQMEITNTEYILSVLRKCENLERLEIELPTGRTRRPDDGANHFIHHINANFHDGFMNAIRKANVNIEFTEYGRTIGCVTEKEIVWRKKRLHWVGYDPIYSKSKLNLLDLANQNNENTKLQQTKNKNPFDLILGYLDLTSLYALYNCNKRGKQLIEQYAQRNSQQQGRFLITDEFHLNYSGMKFFAKYVNNLDVKIIVFGSASFSIRKLHEMIGTSYVNLRKLCLRTPYDRIDPQDFIFPQIQHYIFYGYGASKTIINHLNVTAFSECCPNVKTIELRTAVKLFTDDKQNSQHSFENLQTFKFKPYDEAQVEFAKELFAKKETEIVILE